MILADDSIHLQWLAYFPADILLSAILGSMIAAALVFRSKLDAAASPATPESTSRCWLAVITTVVIGICLSVMSSTAVIDWFSIKTAGYRQAISGGIALFGVPIIEAAMRLGPLGVLKLFISKQLPPDPPKDDRIK